MKLQAACMGLSKEAIQSRKIFDREAGLALAGSWDGKQVWINGGGEPIIAGVHLIIPIVIDNFDDRSNWLVGIFVRNTHLQGKFVSILQIKMNRCENTLDKKEQLRLVLQKFLASRSHVQILTNIPFKGEKRSVF